MQVVIKNLLVEYSEIKKDNDVTLLFLHGWRSSKEVWATVTQELGDRNINIYTLDLPGFGGSPVPKQSMTVGDYSELVFEFINKLELKNVVLVGHSFGGRVGIKLSATHPEALSKLVLVDSAGFVTEGSKKTLVSTLAKIVKPIFKPKAMQSLREKIYKVMGTEDYIATPELQKTFVNVVSEDLAKHLPQIKQPTLILWGENDKDTPVEFGKKMNSLIPNSKLVVFQNAGHFSFLDKTEEFVKALKEFINM